MKITNGRKTNFVIKIKMQDILYASEQKKMQHTHDSIQETREQTLNPLEK